MTQGKQPSPSHSALVAAILTHGILLGPAPCGCLVLAPVGLVHVSNLRNQRVVGIWIR